MVGGQAYVGDVLGLGQGHDTMRKECMEQAINKNECVGNEDTEPGGRSMTLALLCHGSALV